MYIYIHKSGNRLLGVCYHINVATIFPSRREENAMKCHEHRQDSYPGVWKHKAPWKHSFQVQVGECYFPIRSLLYNECGTCP